MSWTLANLRARFRHLTGRGTTGDISDADCNTYITDYLRYRFPIDVQLDRLDSEWTADATATDDGEYTVSEDVLELTEPIFANDSELYVYRDQQEFWRSFPSEEDWITKPTLAVGVSNAAAVKNSAFSYLGSDGRTRSKATAETALSGDTIPQSKYGAWLLEIDDDGTIAVQDASDNATGYDSAALAIDDLPAPSSGCIVMGFVTAINSAATFVPGTTLLSAATVTDTYTDGHPGLRGQPTSILVNRAGGKAYLRPKPDDSYRIKSQASLQRPTTLTLETDTLSDEAWGPAIALGAAVDYLGGEAGEDERVMALDWGGMPYSPENPKPGSLQSELTKIRMKDARQRSGRQIKPSF